MLTRFGISLEGELLAGFDRLITSRGHANRSEAVRDRLIATRGFTHGRLPPRTIGRHLP
jgi:metal-responsive CopG/Arc/MetJ family transcriptional regulator